jgi:hypothetical protein
MTVVNSVSLAGQLKELELMDSKIGDSVTEKSRPFLLLHLDEFLSISEQKIQDRDFEIQKHITWIHKIYQSRRYRLGNSIIRPIEIVLIRLGMIDPSEKDQNTMNRSEH